MQVKDFQKNIVDLDLRQILKKIFWFVKNNSSIKILIFANVILATGVIFFDWGTYSLMFIFLSEGIISIFYFFLKFFTVCIFNIQKNPGEENFFEWNQVAVLFFCAILLLFLIFIAKDVIPFWKSEPIITNGVLLSIVVIFLSHGFSYISNYLLKRHRKISVINIAGYLLIRNAYLSAIIIFGFFYSSFAKASLSAPTLVILILIKTAFDILEEGKEQKDNKKVIISN